MLPPDASRKSLSSDEFYYAAEKLRRKRGEKGRHSTELFLQG